LFFCCAAIRGGSSSIIIIGNNATVIGVGFCSVIFCRRRAVVGGSIVVHYCAVRGIVLRDNGAIVSDSCASSIVIHCCAIVGVADSGTRIIIHYCALISGIISTAINPLLPAAAAAAAVRCRG